MSMNRLALPVLALPRMAKRLVALWVDVSLCILTVWLAYYMRLGTWVFFWGESPWEPYLAAGVSLLIALPVFVTQGFYRAIFRYSGLPALITVTRAMVVYSLLYATVIMAIGLPGVPRTIGLIQPMLLLLTVGASRALIRYWLGSLYQNQLKLAALPRILVYGAGTAGQQLARSMSASQEMQVIGFLDDDHRLHGQILCNLPVYSASDLPDLVTTLRVHEVLLALSSTTRRRRNEILAYLQEASVSVRTLPNLSDMDDSTTDPIGGAELRELDIDDLLGRDAIATNHILLGVNIKGKTVLVTGAGGAIGTELCHQILEIAPNVLLLVEQSEFSLHSLYQSLQIKIGETSIKLVPLLASVRDQERMREIMSTWGPDTIYHTATYKHMSLVEHNPAESLKNNVLGTLTAARAAMEQKVQNFILVSADMAARPHNIMRAGTRLAEIVLQSLAATLPGTRFSIVRFGRILDASATMMPNFRRQIRDGHPIKLAHPDITRHFMTAKQAVQLVIQAGAMGKGGGIFQLSMGSPVKLVDLVRNLIRFSGRTIKDSAGSDGDIAIEFIGLEHAEMLHEEVLDRDNLAPTSHPRIMKAHENTVMEWDILEEKMNALALALNVNDVGVIRLMLEQLVVGYTASGEIVDWIHLEQEAESSILESMHSEKS